MIKKYGLLLVVFSFYQILMAQTPAVSAIRKYADQQTHGIMEEFVQLLSIPNLAKDTVNILKNAEFILNMMKSRSIANTRLLTTTAGTPPVVYGEIMVPGAKQTLIFYAHYDGQPINPDQWAKGLSPYVPKLYTGAIDKNGVSIPFPAGTENYQPDWRIYARSASDDKAGVMAILTAYDAIKKSRLTPTYNLKFFFEGEEEAGSPHLTEFLQKYAALLQSDLWIICDGPVHQSGKKQVVYGVRGDTHLDLTVYGPKRPLHSGHYGNWVPNPAMQLAKLLASMKGDDGRVTVKGFNDDVVPFTASEKKALMAVPGVDEQMKKELGIKEEETAGLGLSEAITQPSLNINGMASGNVGKMASNQIPTFATAVIDLRLVVGNDWQRQQLKVIDHIKAQGYYVLDREPNDAERSQYGKIIKVIAGDDGYNAQRTSMDLPIAKKVVAAVASITNDAVVQQPTLGGSLPLYVFEKYLKAKTVTVPIANHDNNQHAENENIRLQNFFDGIETMAAIMLMEK